MLSRETINLLTFNFIRQSATLAAMIIAKEVTHLIPSIGSLIAAPLSVASTRLVLFKLIEKFERVSMMLVEYSNIEDH